MQYPKNLLLNFYVLTNRKKKLKGQHMGFCIKNTSKFTSLHILLSLMPALNSICKQKKNICQFIDLLIRFCYKLTGSFVRIFQYEDNLSYKHGKTLPLYIDIYINFMPDLISSTFSFQLANRLYKSIGVVRHCATSEPENYLKAATWVEV